MIDRDVIYEGADLAAIEIAAAEKENITLNASLRLANEAGERLRAENAKLRAALKAIADDPDTDSLVVVYARRALASEQDAKQEGK